MNRKTFAIIGGDKRQTYLYEYLSKDFNVITHSVPDIINTNKCVLKTIKSADYILLPIPTTKDGTSINTPFYNEEIPLSIIRGCTCPIFGGPIPCSFETKYTNILSNEALAYKNAALTAEGAIGVAIENSDTAILGSKCAILGFGRIGKILALYLKQLCADVTVFARNEKDISLINALGLKGYSYEKIDKLSSMDYIFNTVPSVILESEVLDLIKDDCTIIELASSPGGINQEYAKDKKLKIVVAMSLPGRKSPKAAAKLIGKVITDKIKEENL